MGCPKKYKVKNLLSRLSTSDSLFELGLLEGLFMIAFTEYASDLDTGVLIPSEVDTDIVRQIKSRDRIFIFEVFFRETPTIISARLVLSRLNMLAF